MPRRSYDAYRADKLATSRRGSMAESETDAESLASFSTFQSNSSYLTQNNSPSPRLSPYQSFPSTLGPNGSSGLPAPPNVHSKLRTFSSSSSSVAGSPSLTPRLEVPRKHSSSLEDRERRRKRREERARKSTLVGELYDSPLRRWLRWMSANGLSGWTMAVGLIAVGVVKTAVGYGGFSGQDSPPRFGDFEAQRHWMEVTIHRPIAEWYTYAPDWWLLDYPPLTAYASWLCGRIGSALNPNHFALDTSWGSSPPDLVTLMRFSVLSFEAAVWWSAVVAWMILEGRKGGRSWRSQMTGIMTVLLQPSLALVDNGHFQYNSVLLGLSLWTVILISHDQDILACIAFSLALGFKQMGLYYAPAIGCYLLGKCLWLGGIEGIAHFAKLGIATASTFILLFFPWLRPFPGPLLHVLHRIFPFARGIFEDKVANFWCASNVVLKWRRYFSIPGMARLATAATLAALVPTILILISTSLSSRPTSGEARRSPPTSRLVLLAMFTASMSFFLFSFQVHEKSILLPLMPLTVMAAMRGGRGEGAEAELWEVSVLVNNVAVFSMWPLLVRDGQSLQYVATTALWNYVIGYTPWDVTTTWVRHGGYATYAVMAAIHLPDVFPHQLPPPTRYPDLYIVLNTLLSFGVLSLAWLWGNKKLLEAAWAAGGLGGSAGITVKGKKTQ